MATVSVEWRTTMRVGENNSGCVGGLRPDIMLASSSAAANPICSDG